MSFTVTEIEAVQAFLRDHAKVNATLRGQPQAEAEIVIDLNDEETRHHIEALRKELVANA